MRSKAKITYIAGQAFSTVALDAICAASSKLKPHIGYLWINVKKNRWGVHIYGEPSHEYGDILFYNPILKKDLIAQIEKHLHRQGAIELMQKASEQKFRSQEGALKDLLTKCSQNDQ